MGILKELQQSDAQANSGAPWYLDSGHYPSGLARVEVKTGSKLGPKNIYALHFAPECKPPTTDDIPRPVLELDMNDPQDVRALKGIIGNPMLDAATKTVKWDSTGLYQWNGQTGDKSSITGRAEITLETRPPQPKTGDKGGWWWARYTVKDVSPVGEADAMATKAAMDIMGETAPDTTGAPPVQPPTKHGRR